MEQQDFRMIHFRYNVEIIDKSPIILDKSRMFHKSFPRFSGRHMNALHLLQLVEVIFNGKLLIHP